MERDFRVLDAGGSVPDHELVIADRIYLVSVAPLRNAFGRVEAISVAHTDITDQKRVERELAIVNHRLSQLSTIDYLTGLSNRRHFDDALGQEISRCREAGRSLSLLMIDIDHFKQYNDAHGHLVGDRCLREVADCLAASLADHAALLSRFGGEEFAVLLPGVEDAVAAAMADECRRAMLHRALAHRNSPFGLVTMSIGVATMRFTDDTIPDIQYRDSLISDADRALYDAKHRGRNRVAARMDAPLP